MEKLRIEKGIFTNMALAEELALATAADCFHNDPDLDWDECNGWPAYNLFENHLTGRVVFDGEGAYVEMTCPKCGETSWAGDSEFFTCYEIFQTELADYVIQSLNNKKHL